MNLKFGVFLTVTVLVAFLMSYSNMTGAEASYSAFEGFSGISNPTPDGMWRYGYSIGLGGTLILYTSTTLHGHYTSAPTQWTDGYRIDPNVIKNETGQDIVLPLSGYFIIPAEDYLYMHPGPSNDFSVIRWTAPATGAYEIDSVFRAPENTCPTTADVHVLHNETSLFDAFVEIDGVVSDQDPRAFTTQLALEAGDTIDFSVGYGANNNHICDRMLLKATITLMESTVSIDIKPSAFPNPINPGSNGVIPVAILTTDAFDASIIDSLTLTFGRTGTEAPLKHAAMEDVDADGDLDMICHFRTDETGIQCGDTAAILMGETYDGMQFTGSDSIITVGCKKPFQSWINKFSIR